MPKKVFLGLWIWPMWTNHAKISHWAFRHYYICRPVNVSQIWVRSIENNVYFRKNVVMWPFSEFSFNCDSVSNPSIVRFNPTRCCVYGTHCRVFPSAFSSFKQNGPKERFWSLIAREEYFCYVKSIFKGITKAKETANQSLLSPFWSRQDNISFI